MKRIAGNTSCAVLPRSSTSIPWGKSRRFPGRNPVGALSFASSKESCDQVCGRLLCWSRGVSLTSSILAVRISVRATCLLESVVSSVVSLETRNDEVVPPLKSVPRRNPPIRSYQSTRACGYIDVMERNLVNT